VPGGAGECYDRVRYTLSDEGGELRFTAFKIVDGAACGGVEHELEQYLLSRPLSRIDVKRIRQLSCPGDRQCIETIAEVVSDQQALFAGDGNADGEEMDGDT
jgi:hypothetical protein